MALITLLRHAPLPIDYQQRYIGHSDIDIDSSLIDFDLIEELKSNYNFDLVYSSDLTRCVKTTQYITDDFICDKRLREMKFKDYIEGKTFEEIEKNDNYKIEHLDSVMSWFNYICEESLKEFKLRVEEFLNSLPKNKKILICTHGGTIRMFHALLSQKEFDFFYFKIDYLEALRYNTNL